MILSYLIKIRATLNKFKMHLIQSVTIALIQKVTNISSKSNLRAWEAFLAAMWSTW